MRAKDLPLQKRPPHSASAKSLGASAYSTGKRPSSVKKGGRVTESRAGPAGVAVAPAAEVKTLEKQKLKLFAENLTLQRELETLSEGRLGGEAGALQDMEYLRSVYERRCQTLGEIALHWKEKTKQLADRYY